MRTQQAKQVRLVIKHIVLIILSLLMIFPFLWMISSSLKSEGQIFSIPARWIPNPVNTSNYSEMLKSAPWLLYFKNTVIVTVLVIIGQIITSSFAAYAFARLKFKGRNALFIIYLGTMMIPFQVTMISLFRIVGKMGLIDSLFSLIITGIFSPFGAFLLRQFFLGIPTELEEAAKIDGCSYPRIYYEIFMKNSKPALITLVIITFMNTWNDFLKPLIFINTQERWTISLGLAKFQGTYTTKWGQMMAASLLSMIPVMAIYLLCQRYFVEGIVMSGMKE